MKKRFLAIFYLLLIGIWLQTGVAEARHLKLYGYGLVDKGTGTITYNFDYINGPKSGTQEGNPTLHEVELEYAFSKHWVQSLYVDYDYTAAANGNGVINEATAVKTEFNINFYEQGEMPVDFRINVELAKAINNNRDAYGSRNTMDTAEVRLIFEKSFDGFSIILGPLGLKEISGPVPVSDQWNYAYANAIMIDVNDKLQFSLEFFGDLGTSKNMIIDTTQSHTIVPNLNIAVGKDSTLSLGVGIPLTDVTDDLAFRMSFAYNWKKFW